MYEPMDFVDGDFGDIVVCFGCVYRPDGEPELPSFCLVLGRDADGHAHMCAATFVEE
jgi:hypothetical protein